MSRLLTGLAICGMLAFGGCANVSPIAPIPDVFSAMEAQSAPAVQPLPLGARPAAQVLRQGDAEYLCFAPGAAQELLAQRVASEANTRIAGELAGQVDALQLEREALINTGRACEQHDALLAQALADARSDAATELFWHRALIGGLLLVLIL